MMTIEMMTKMTTITDVLANFHLERSREDVWAPKAPSVFALYSE